jgi:asparagine N-glycosylation enzyme membrane subunit Stt3
MVSTMLFTDLLIGFLSIMLPGFFLALGLLKKTKLNLFEISVIGFIFGMIFPPMLTWTESYFRDIIHAFSFSAGLYNINVILLTIIGIAISYQQGALDLSFLKKKVSSSKSNSRVITEINASARERITHLRKQFSSAELDMTMVKAHEKEEEDLVKRNSDEIEALKKKGAGSEELEHVKKSHIEEENRLISEHEREEKHFLSSGKSTAEKSSSSDSRKWAYVVWGILFAIMLITFASRIINIGNSPKYFEFDPYFDMLSTRQILAYGYQFRLDYSAWPVNNGTTDRIQPLIPYLEAYWYRIADTHPSSSTISTNLLSLVSSYYPPITAALLVFIVFMFVYHEYGSLPALTAAALVATMPTLITTFIAGEQLLEPWGIFALFFMVAAYSLAVKNPKEKRYAILAGIAFASNFLGAHYYNVTAAVLALYILVQGILDTLRKKSSIDFFKSNGIMLLVIIIFYVIYAPYNATLTNRIPSILGIPTIIGFPLIAFIAALIFEYLPMYLEKYKLLKRTTVNDLVVRIGLLVLILALAVLSPLSKPITSFLALASHFTTPSTPLFMTVQEYVTTGAGFNFGSAGFGVIGAAISGFPITVWIILVLFGIFTIYDIFVKDSRSAIFTFVMVAVLTVAGMSEIKYLPHFGVAYIIALGIVIGELYIFIKKLEPSKRQIATYALIAIILIAIIFESVSMLSTFTAYGKSCNNVTNVVAATMYCNTLTNQWLNALSWMKSNIGPHAPRILAWWDYGDWINWFGNSNAVIRGDNAVATLDYNVAAHFVLGNKDGYNATRLASFMDNTAQAGYLLFDNQLVQKWSALDFLACVDINQTSRAYAISQGVQYNQPFLIGTSPCETAHDPVDIAIPEQPTINQYCSFSNTTTAVQGLALVGETIPNVLNSSYCVSTTPNSNGVLDVYNENGTKTNIVLSTNYILGNLQGPNGQTLLEFFAIYLPNGPNDTITNAPTEFYSSTYYKGFFFGKLPGYTLVYPENFSGINMVNSSNQVMILKLNNYTGKLPYIPPKPSWVHNNYTIPG